MQVVHHHGSPSVRPALWQTRGVEAGVGRASEAFAVSLVLRNLGGADAVDEGLARGQTVEAYGVQHRRRDLLPPVELAGAVQVERVGAIFHPGVATAAGVKHDRHALVRHAQQVGRAVEQGIGGAGGVGLCQTRSGCEASGKQAGRGKQTSGSE